jgi:hypothetical protein
MPFQSKQQAKFAFATKQSWAKEWADKTNFSKLPKKKKKKSISKMPIEKAIGTTSGGTGVIAVGMGSYPKVKNKKRKNK